jgi:hypothetical protein
MLVLLRPSPGPSVSLVTMSFTSWSGMFFAFVVSAAPDWQEKNLQRTEGGKKRERKKSDIQLTLPRHFASAEAHTHFEKKIILTGRSGM